jgi:hypothetical protein
MIPDMSEVMFVSTSAQMKAAFNVAAASVAGAKLLQSPKPKSFGTFLDDRLTLDTDVIAVDEACHFHIWALRHMHYILPLNITQTVVCNLTSSRLDQSRSLLYGAPHAKADKLQKAHDLLARMVL